MKIYGVWFGNKHSFNDWGCYLKDNNADFPTPQRIMIKVPYHNGLLDITRALAGDRIFYESRKVTYEFLIIDNERTWPQIYSQVARDVHGKSLQIRSDTDPQWYWNAYNCKVIQPDKDEDQSTFKIECECAPFKKRVDETVITIEVPAEETEFHFPNDRQEVVPVFYPLDTGITRIKYVNEFGETVTDTIDGSMVDSKSFYDLYFKEGDNVLTLSNSTASHVAPTNTIRVKYRQGAL